MSALITGCLDPAEMNEELRPGPNSAGLGLRRDLMDEFLALEDGAIDFFEVAPENWIGLGGRWKARFDELAERLPITTHGLSLSLGGPNPLDQDLVRNIRVFLDTYGIDIYSEHLSYCSDHAQLYDLAPIPFTEEAVHHVAGRIREVQDMLDRQLIIENVSYYAAPGQQMEEADFVRAVLEEADCLMLLDVNNIYVNSINHGYAPTDYMSALPAERIAYYHVAGHYNEAKDLIVDTHGADVIDPVWELLEDACRRFGPLPTLLERDFNFPPMGQLLDEVEHIRRCQQQIQPV